MHIKRIPGKVLKVSLYETFQNYVKRKHFGGRWGGGEGGAGNVPRQGRVKGKHSGCNIQWNAKICFIYKRNWTYNIYNHLHAFL